MSHQAFCNFSPWNVWITSGIRPKISRNLFRFLSGFVTYIQGSCYLPEFADLNWLFEQFIWGNFCWITKAIKPDSGVPWHSRQFGTYSSSWTFAPINLLGFSRSLATLSIKVAGVWVWTQWTRWWPWPDPRFGSWKGTNCMVHGSGVWHIQWPGVNLFDPVLNLQYVAFCGQWILIWNSRQLQGLKLTQALCTYGCNSQEVALLYLYWQQRYYAYWGTGQHKKWVSGLLLNNRRIILICWQTEKQCHFCDLSKIGR